MQTFLTSVFLFLIITVIEPQKEIVLHLGGLKCYIEIYNKDAGQIPLIRLHGDEKTDVRAFFDLPVKNGFVFYKLSQFGKRLLEFKEGKKIYYFDPNRIFSKKGIAASLKKYNRTYPRGMIQKIFLFSKQILSITGISQANKEIVAIHNNTNGNFSAITFNHYSTAAKIYIEKSGDPDDFFIVTGSGDFAYFKRMHQNVVLQSKYAQDDGSLSIYCQRNSIRYINIEAQTGHKKQQEKMLLLCLKLLSIN